LAAEELSTSKIMLGNIFSRYFKIFNPEIKHDYKQTTPNVNGTEDYGLGMSKIKILFPTISTTTWNSATYSLAFI